MSADVPLEGDGELAKRIRADEKAAEEAVAKSRAELAKTIARIDALAAGRKQKPKRPPPPRQNSDGQAIH